VRPCRDTPLVCRVEVLMDAEYRLRWWAARAQRVSPSDSKCFLALSQTPHPSSVRPQRQFSLSLLASKKQKKAPSQDLRDRHTQRQHTRVAASLSNSQTEHMDTVGKMVAGATRHVWNVSCIRFAISFSICTSGHCQPGGKSETPVTSRLVAIASTVTTLSRRLAATACGDAEETRAWRKGRRLRAGACGGR
jgi:hypothetical protein